ncbi:MAG TPA: sugar ABC transporter permease, partial [Nannocystaceae bacterium]|nr:sugar ABC transporter permease [Nannocystaceae bacterium]
MTPARRAFEALAVHAVLLVGVAFALYPVLWVAALAFSGTPAPEPSIVPIPREPTFAHFRDVVGATIEAEAGTTWLFGQQLGNSLLVAGATALVGVVLAIPTAYALARFDFVGKHGGLRVLLATQMFPAVASAIPLYLILEGVGLLNTR